MTHPTWSRAAPALLAGAIALGGAAAANAQAKASAPAAATSPSSPAKKELVQRVLRAQQSDIESIARSLVERPAAQMMQEAGLAIQRSIAVDKREAVGKSIEVEVKKYVDESYPLVRDRAIKSAPGTIGAALEAKMSEDELKQLLAWIESPAAKHFAQVAGESRNAFIQQVLSESGPLVQPKLVALDGRIRSILGVGPAGADPGLGAPTAPAAPKPASK